MAPSHRDRLVASNFSRNAGKQPAGNFLPIQCVGPHPEFRRIYRENTCGACIKRCPVKAITKDGHEKARYFAHATQTCVAELKPRLGLDIVGCGRCQTGVPCEHGIPVGRAAIMF